MENRDVRRMDKVVRQISKISPTTTVRRGVILDPALPSAAVIVEAVPAAIGHLAGRHIIAAPEGRRWGLWLSGVSADTGLYISSVFVDHLTVEWDVPAALLRAAHGELGRAIQRFAANLDAHDLAFTALPQGMQEAAQSREMRYLALSAALSRR